MSFLAPLAFWGAAIVVPALLILYFLKLRRREELVPSTLLWKRAVQDLQVNAPFQRLRKNLLLLLQLLILAAAIFALARPIVETTTGAEGRLVILIDNSASMNAYEGDQTRLDLAKEQGVRLVKTLNRRADSWLSFLHLGGAENATKAMIIAFSDRASVIAPFTPNTADLVDVIRDIKPTDGQTNIHEAMALAEAYMAPPTRITQQMEGADSGMNAAPGSTEPPAKLILISDGAIPDLDSVVLREGQIELMKIGETHDNVGLTTLRVQRNYERPELVNAFLEVRNFGDEPVTTDVSILVNGELVSAGVRTVSLAAAPKTDKEHAATATQPQSDLGSSQGIAFELPLDRAGVIQANLSRKDALAADDRVFAVVPPPRRLRVLVVTEKNFFLDSVLRGLPLAERVFMTPTEYEHAPKSELQRDGQSTYDVVVFDKYQPGDLPVGNYLFIDALPKLDGVESEGEFDQPHALIWWDETHPILRHVSLDYVYVGKSLIVKLPRDAETLIEGPKGPILARLLRDGSHYLLLTFPIEQSNWWQKPGFPVFAYNALRYLGGGGALADRGPTRPGETLQITLPTGVSEATAIHPDGRRDTVRPDMNGFVYYGATAQAGVYQVEYDQNGETHTDAYAVNLEDARESDIRPRGADEYDPSLVVAGKLIETATPEVWRWFMGAALLILLAEWYVYNRRVMI